MEKRDIAKMIEYTIIKSDAMKNCIIKLCDETMGSLDFSLFMLIVPL